VKEERSIYSDVACDDGSYLDLQGNTLAISRITSSQEARLVIMDMKVFRCDVLVWCTKENCR
jgi:hypothetical protein